MVRVKKILDFATDYMLSILLLAILSAAFVTTLSFSPQGFTAENRSDVSILGMNTSASLVFKETAEQNSMTVIYGSGHKDYQLKISSSNVPAREITSKLFLIKNNSNTNQKISVSPKIAERFLEGMKYTLLVNDSGFDLFDGQVDNLIRDYELTIAPGEEANLGLAITSNKEIGYPIDFVLNVYSGELETLP